MKKWANRGPLPALSYKRLTAAYFILALLALWELACRAFDIPEFMLPAPSKIAKALAGNFPLLLRHTTSTIYAVAAGLALAILVAVILALVMDCWPLVKKMLYPPLVISQAVPIFALAPVILVWLGVDLKPKIAVVALVCFFPLAINLVESLNQVNPEALELMQVMQASPWFTFRSVQLPSVMPYFFSGLKISATYSVMGAIIGEWLGGNIGLGVYMTRARYSSKTSHLFAAIFIVVILSLALFKLSELLAWITMPWNRANQTKE
ncbi:MAG TPA: ABC transporter permease [Firmicutes bacterium]|nr:ABC transporter permease [Bacillota bacterium]